MCAQDEKCLWGVNVNTTELRIHTHTPCETRSMRELAASRMVKASAAWMAVEMLATWCVRKLWGDARPSPYRVLSVAPGRRV